jgi:hypothetical protein
LTLRFRQFRALTICCEETLTLRFKQFRALKSLLTTNRQSSELSKT